MEKIRLQKFFTDNKIMSRRKAEDEIKLGHVTVNGEVAVIGQKVDPENDTVFLNGKKVERAQGRVYIMLNKPLGYVTTSADEKGRDCVSDLVRDVGERVYPVGRLDMFSEGLLIMTNDGEMANRLTHPSHNIPKIYSVKIKGAVTDDVLFALTQPMDIDGYTIRPVGVRKISEKSGATNLIFTLHEGRNRQIRRMCEKFSLTVMNLTRTAVGDVRLGDLPKGKWRYLTDGEISYLCGKEV